MQTIKYAAKVVGWTGAALAVHLGWRAARDLRERAHPALQDLEQLRARVDDAARTAARIDHDLRTPIGTLMSAIELMRAQPDDAGLRAEALEVMTRQAARMTGLAESLRTLARQLDEASLR